jgi:uncharacterized protein (DUF2336 family)
VSLASDVEMLKKNPLPEVRQSIVEKVTLYLKVGVFNDEERALAFDIIRLLAKDVEMRVRKTLSENLKTNPNVPHDIIIGLAYDVVAVSAPILEFSSVLTDGDLIEIIRSAKQVAQLTAISRRENIAEVVSSALAHTRNEQVVLSLCDNKSARISEESLKVVIDQFSDNSSIVDSLVNRGGLPIGIVEKMIVFISDSMREKLTAQYNISDEVAAEVVVAASEQAALDLLYEPPVLEPLWLHPAEQILMVKTEQLVKHLHKEGRLTQSIIIRALCEGNLRFFEASMAILAGVPIMNARKLIRSKNATALESLFRKAKLPSSSLNAVNIVIDFATTAENSNLETSIFKRRLVEHIVSKGFDKNVPLMPYVIAIISSKVGTDDVVGTRN